jgi:hypothetical protein
MGRVLIGHDAFVLLYKKISAFSPSISTPRSKIGVEELTS